MLNAGFVVKTFLRRVGVSLIFFVYGVFGGFIFICLFVSVFNCALLCFISFAVFLFYFMRLVIRSFVAIRVVRRLELSIIHGRT